MSFQRDNPGLIHLRINYSEEGANKLCYVLTLSNERVIYLYINMFAKVNTRGILTPLRRHVEIKDYLAVIECGKVPINNLDPVIRVRPRLSKVFVKTMNESQ